MFVPTQFETSSIQKLSEVIRYSTILRLKNESVAEHSYFVILESLLVASDLINQGIDVNLESLLVKAVLHDIEEVATGDFVRTFKRSTPTLKQEIDKATEVCVPPIVASLFSDPDTIDSPLVQKFVEKWKEAKSSDLEGYIVYFCDLHSVIIYAKREMSLGSIQKGGEILKEATYWMIKLKKEMEKYECCEPLMPYVTNVIEKAQADYDTYCHKSFPALV